MIAVFYTNDLSTGPLGLAAVLLAILALLNALGLRNPAVYVLGGALVWAAVLGLGVRVAVAGVLVAMTVPARPKAGPGWFLDRVRALLRE